MSYYILPKITNYIFIEPLIQEHEPEIYLSHSLVYYYNDTMQLIKKLSGNETDPVCSNYEELTKIVNPYEYIYSKVTGTKYSVSKIKPFSNVFYDFLEIYQKLNIFESYFEKNIISIHIGKNNNSTLECINMIREDNNDVNIGYNKIEEFSNNLSQNSINFLFYEYNSSNNIFIGLLTFITKLLKYQITGGSCLIKIENIFTKPMIDILYILSSLYEKTFIFKPNTSNITHTEKYIVCKYFIGDCEKNYNYYYKLKQFIETYNTGYVSLVVKNEIPYYFINKIEEANIIVGQNQLESLDQIVNILKNKNREEKIELLKKNNLQKCIVWCDKYKIPYNKFSEKVNIFLPFFKSSNEFITEDINQFEETKTESHEQN